MKNRSINMLIVALLVIGAMAVTLIVFIMDAKESFPEDITVVEDGVTETILPVRDLMLNPTESREYSVNLFCKASGGYHVYLDFEETEDGGMKPFVDVTVKVDGELLYEGKLDALLAPDAKTVDCEVELYAEEARVFTVTYTMPRDVGNEAQGTYSDFDLSLKIEKS